MLSLMRRHLTLCLLLLGSTRYVQCNTEKIILNYDAKEAAADMFEIGKVTAVFSDGWDSTCSKQITIDAASELLETQYSLAATLVLADIPFDTAYEVRVCWPANEPADYEFRAHSKVYPCSSLVACHGAKSHIGLLELHRKSTLVPIEGKIRPFTPVVDIGMNDCFYEITRLLILLVLDKLQYSIFPYSLTPLLILLPFVVTLCFKVVIPMVEQQLNSITGP